MALEIVRPDSVRAAAATLAADKGARFIGGGTLAIRDVNYGDGSTTKLLLPDALKLDQIVVADGTVTIGAATTMAAIARHSKLAFLKPVASSIGGPVIRAMATVGGNVFAPYPFGDFTVAMLALDGKVRAESVGGEETLSLEDFLARDDSNIIVTSISFAEPEANSFRFAKVVRRKPHGASVLSIAALLPIASGKISGARIAYGAMAPRPMRARDAERALEGKALDAGSITAAVKAANSGCAPLTDPQASDWYRLAVLPVHLQRLLSA